MPPMCRLGHQSENPADAHGCPKCPHSVKGPAVTGSPTVKVNGKPALRITDMGIHLGCCAANMWTATKGSPTVIINYLAAVRKGDMTTHCGGFGQMIDGSPDVECG